MLKYSGIFAAALALLAGCASVQVGAGWQPNGADRPEVEGAGDPLVMVLVESHPIVPRVRLFGMHLGDAPQVQMRPPPIDIEDGRSLDILGATIELRP